MAHIIYPKNRPQTAAIPVEAVTDQGPEPALEPAIDSQIATDAQVAADHTSALMARIRASSNKSELLIQFCEESDMEGVKSLFRACDLGQISYTYNNLRAWRLCTAGNATQQSIARILLTKSGDLQKIHARALWGAITDNNQTLINQLLQYTDLIGLNTCASYAKLATAAAITCGVETVTHLLQLKDATCSKSSCICNRELDVLYNAIDSGNTGVLEPVLLMYASNPEALSKLDDNANLLCTALMQGHAGTIQMILDNLPFSTSNDYYISNILSSAINSEPEITKAVFDVFGDRLTTAAICAPHLTRACSTGQAQVVKILCAKGSFNPETVRSCLSSSLESGQTEIAVTLFESNSKVLVPTVIELGSGITDPTLRKAISSYLTSLAEQYA
ncbi:Hypothetical protein MVR_LOCUS60 [uncultured virus]|nr:Hypothetical protein MVR_LOCUS60 [uncultured virus]